MKVLHTISGLSVFGGGPSLSTLLTVQGLRHSGVEARILTYKPTQKGDKLISTAEYIHALDATPDARFAYSSAFRRELPSHLEGVDIVHAQGVWQYPTHASAVVARRKHIPYVVSLRGMMYPQAMQSSAWIKKLSLLLYQRSDLQQAACIQATCKEEYRFYREAGFTNPVAILPNPIDLTGIVDKPIPQNEKFRIGYIGRIHPRKRVERLIYAFSCLAELVRDCELVIIGGGDADYEAFLQGEVRRLALENVRFTGFLSGEQKDRALNSLSYLFVPSDFENFGNIVTEALVRGIPVAASKGMPWQELDEYRCGWWIDNDVDSITATMQAALFLPSEERVAMGMRGKQLMRERYGVDVLGQKMKSVYQWLLGGDKPDCVYTE